MIRKPSNWNEVTAYSERRDLPLGAYVCTIKKAQVVNTDYGEQLAVLFDISEGEYAGYYDEDYRNNNNADKKYRGVLRLWLPKDDGSEKDEWTKSTFKGFVTALEKSNMGFTWNWNEASLAGREIGVLMRNEEWVYNGKTGWKVKPFRTVSSDKVRSGDYRLPKDKPSSNKPSSDLNSLSQYDNVRFENIEDEDGDLPF